MSAAHHHSSMRYAAASAVLLAAALLLAAAPPSAAQLPPPTTSAFLGQLGGGAANTTTSNTPISCANKTAPKLVIESVLPVPGAGQVSSITIRNQGGSVANITGYTLVANGSNTTDNSFTIAGERRCVENGTVPPAESITFTPRSDTNPCGFPFTLGETGSVSLNDAGGKTITELQWSGASQGVQVHINADASGALRIPANQDVIEVLKSLGNYQTLLLALQSTGLDTQLKAASNPNYVPPQLPQPTYTFDLPWWFAGAQVGAAPPPPPPPPPAIPEPGTVPVGVPAAGPFTIFAPDDAAFDQLLVNLGGTQGKLPLSALLQLPQLKDILLYHIVPGLYTTDYMRNNTPVFTAKGVEVVPFTDGCMTQGKLMLSDSCIDKPTADNFTCAEQATFRESDGTPKCQTPVLTSPVSAQWQGGYCQRTCQRCDCSPASGILCATVTIADIDSSNGVIHSISRVLFPPPLFTKEAAIQAAVAYNQSLALNQSLGIAPAPGMVLPGAVSAATPAAASNASLPGATATNATVPAAAAGGSPPPSPSPAAEPSPAPASNATSPAAETEPTPAAGANKTEPAGTAGGPGNAAAGGSNTGGSDTGGSNTGGSNTGGTRRRLQQHLNRMRHYMRA